MLEKRRLGTSDLEISTLTLGCWIFGGGSYWGEMAQSETNNVLARALDEGINLFDTAEGYNDGGSEASLGLALKGRRHEALILTKLNPGEDARNLAPRLDKCLERLRTDYMDILMIHWPSADEQVTMDALEAFRRFRQAGKVREIGVSNFGVYQMGLALNAGIRPVVNELPYNLISRAIEHEILPMCIREQIGVITYSTLQQGILTGKYKSPDELPPNPAHSRHFANERGRGTSRHGEPGAESQIFALLDRMHEISAQIGASMADLSIAWSLAQSGITSTIVGCRNLVQLSDNLAGARYRLNPDIEKKLTAYSQPVLDALGFSADYYQNRNNSRIR